MTMPFTLDFKDVSATDLPRVGGKGANLGEMSRAGFPVPPGFCVTTAAFDAFLAGCDGLPRLFDTLDAVDGKDAAAARVVAESTRATLLKCRIPPAVAETIIAAWKACGDAAYAVRSSATAEDLPDASFAGQQDTYLNVRGEDALLDAVRRCWVSLFTDRAVLYRARNGFGHRGVKLSVVVQRMVLPEISGILFTADPVHGRRTTASIEAGWGLGEALVGGLVDADLFRVDKVSGEILEAKIGDKKLAIRPLPEGGTVRVDLAESERRARTLDDARLRELTSLGVRVEAHYGKPQDIEWCIESGRLYLVQTRPITSLYPLPEPPPDDGALHAYVSFGHVQMMTDPMPPLAIQVWKLTLPFGRPASAPLPVESTIVTEAGSRIYLDLTPILRRGPARRLLPKLFGQVYPDIGDGVRQLLDRMEATRNRGEKARIRTIVSFIGPIVARVVARFVFVDPARLKPEAEAFTEALLREARARLDAARTLPDRLRVAQEILATTFARVFRFIAPSLPAGFASYGILHRLVASGALPAAPEDVLALQRGLHGNVTTDMDLAVGDLIDLVRDKPALLELLRTRPFDEALAQAPPDFAKAWAEFMRKYGMRGPGEVDLSRPRYEDDPAPLVRTILGSVGASRVPGEHRARHAALAKEADSAADRLIAAARRGPLGWLKARFVRRLVRVARGAMALREHPKFHLVRVLDLVRKVVREAGRGLVERGSLAAVDDVYLFRFEELAAALASNTDLREEALARRAVLRRDALRTAPLLVASDGDIPAPPVRKDLPPGAMAGTAASAGVVEGVARVVLDPASEVLLDGEILVAPHTDPGWTPLFVHAAGLVTEVGGLITHGSVIAREYGIPAVVSVKDATRKIATGQRIRVDGTRGLVEILPYSSGTPSRSQSL